MAKITGPLHSTNATGSLAGAITYRDSKGGAVAHKMPTASKSKTPAQLARRSNYAAACTSWNALPAQTKIEWALIGATRNISGFNAFISSQLQAPTPPAQRTFSKIQLLPGMTNIEPLAAGRDIFALTGRVTLNGIDVLFRWDETNGFTTMELPLGWTFAIPYAISGDGNTIAGMFGDGLTNKGFSWSAGTGFIEIPNTLGATEFRVTASSYDAHMLAGAWQGPTGERMFTYTAALGMVDCGALEQMGNTNPKCITNGTEQVIGTASLAGIYRAYYWDVLSGIVPLQIIDPPELEEGHGISDDGLVKVSIAYTGSIPQVYRHTAQTGWQQLQPPADATAIYDPRLSADGSTIVAGYDMPTGQSVCWWNAQLQLQTIQMPPGISDLWDCYVSADGLTLAMSAWDGADTILYIYR